MLMRCRVKLTFLLASLFWAFGNAEAVPITYTEQVTATGSLGSSIFTNALVTITFTGDTNNVYTPVFGALAKSAGTTVVAVAGLGTATFTDSMAVFDTPSNNGAGIADFTASSDVLDIMNTAFATYDLRTSIGPLLGNTTIFPTNAFNTTQGAFDLSSVSASGVFSASIVPEPNSLAFICLGISTIGICTFKRAIARTDEGPPAGS